MPLSVMLSAFFFCTWNGYLQGRHLTTLSCEDVSHVSSLGGLRSSTMVCEGDEADFQSTVLAKREVRYPVKIIKTHDSFIKF